MPAWLTYVLKFLLGQFVPVIADWLIRNAKKIQIDKEVEQEFEEFESVKIRAQNWLRANPGKELPKEIEDSLRDHARKRLRGLR